MNNRLWDYGHISCLFIPVQHGVNRSSTRTRIQVYGIGNQSYFMFIYTTRSTWCKYYKQHEDKITGLW